MFSPLALHLHAYSSYVYAWPLGAHQMRTHKYTYISYARTHACMHTSVCACCVMNRTPSQRCHLREGDPRLGHRMLRRSVPRPSSRSDLRTKLIVYPRPHLILEFIHLISSEANEICEQDSKKTIAPEHIIGALKVRPSVSLSPYRPIAWSNG